MDPILLDLAAAFAAGEDVRPALGDRLEELGYGEIRDWHFGRPGLRMGHWWKPCVAVSPLGTGCWLPRSIAAGWEALDRDRLSCRSRLAAMEQALNTKEPSR